MTGTVEVLTGGRLYRGWREVEISRSLDNLSAAFRLKVTDLRAGLTAWPLQEGDTAEVRLDGDVVLTGRIDVWAPSLSAEDHSIAIAGRDLTADLIDCSCILTPGSWRKITLADLAAKVAAPYGLDVEIDAGLDIGSPFDQAQVNPGETAWEVIERHARQRGVLVTSTADGKIRLTRPGFVAQAGPIVEGGNMLEGSAEHSAAERYGRYIVKAQRRGKAGLYGKQASEVSVEIADPEVVRSERALLVIAETGLDLAEARKRAEWERAVRVGRASRARVTVDSWRDEAGELWTVGQSVTVQAPTLRIVGQVLIAGVTYILDDSGERAEIDLVRLGAYQIGDPPTPSKQGGDGFRFVSGATYEAVGDGKWRIVEPPQ